VFANRLSSQIIPKTTVPLQVPSGSGVCSPEKTCADLAPGMIKSALGASPLEENLRHLTNDIGGRIPGSPANQEAVAWAESAFRSAGVSDVKLEPATLPVAWSEGSTRLTILSGEPFPIRLVSVGWSPPTPDGGIAANVVDVGEADEPAFARAGSNVRGAIVLVHQPLLASAGQLLAEYERDPAVIDRSLAAGAAAILWMSDRPGALLYRHTSAPGGGVLERIPQAIVARDDAEKIARAIASGQPLRIRLDMPNRISGPTIINNVVAEIRGREKPDEFVLLGAHLDSWELGTGALDDGTGDAVVIDAARVIKASGTIPRRSVRFVLFNGEEQVLVGSHAYVVAHRPELDRMIAAIIFDSGDGAINGYSVAGRQDMIPALRTALAPLAALGVTEFTDDSAIETGNFDFLLEGVPTLLPRQEMSRYLPNYHASSDTFDRIDVQQLKKLSAIAAITAFALADESQRIAPRQSRAQIEQLLQQTSLDEQMHREGFWDDWQAGRRGRAK
jgi:carboxypeptidase Q